MEYVTLGKTGLRVSRMGLGGIPIQRIDAEGTKTLLHKLADQGVNYIDTARGYTVSEEYLGYALEGIRDRFIIATKSMARTKEAMAEDIEKSLHNLRTDHIELYQVHNPSMEQLDQVIGEGGALEALLEHTKVIEETETVPLLQACGRVLAKDMIAGFDNPPFDRSPVDGYACKAEDIMDASESHPVQLTVLEEIDAGQYSRVTVEKGQAVRIMTGAAIPKGCDCCVRQEDTDYGEETVRIFRPTGQWQNYCYQGENFKNRTVLLKKGDKIGFIEAGILASMGVIKVKVYRRVRAAVLTTGDEVMAPGKRLIPGKIYDCNQGLLAARMKEFGAELVEVAAIEDRPQAMTAAGEVMALDWGITLQCDTTGKEDASSVGVRSHFIHPVLPEADGTTKNVFPCKVERVIEDVFSYILIVSTKEEARIRVDVTKEQWQQYQKHISGNKIWIGIDEKDVMLLK